MRVNKVIRTAMGALTAASLCVVVACAPRLGVVPTSSPVGSQAVKTMVGQPGSLVVPVQFPAAHGRKVQYAYNNGFINAIEVTVADSLGRHLSYMVLRNPGAVGQPGQQVPVLFQNVAPGVATVTVRTSFVQLIGANQRLRPVAGSPSQFTDSNNGNQTVTAVVGDITQPVLVFSSTDLGATATSPTQLSFYNSNNSQVTSPSTNNSSELNDTTTTLGGYGVGAATGSVAANNTSTVSITVGQMPAFASSVIGTTRQIDAGTQVEIPLTSTASFQAGDQILVARGSNIQTTSDFVDITKTNQYDLYPAQIAVDGTVAITFTPTRSTWSPSNPFNQSGAVNYYLCRGEAVSLIGGTASGAGPGQGVNLCMLWVHPAALSVANSSVTTGADDGGLTNSFARAANQTDTINITLKDSFGNLVTGPDFGTRQMDSYVWRPMMQQQTTALNLANNSNNVVWVPGSTIGTLTTPSYNAGTGTFQSTFTQGGAAATQRGASASAMPNVGGTNIASASFIYDPGNTGGATFYTIAVAQDPTFPTNPNRIWWTLNRNGSTFLASGSYLTAAAAPAVINLTPSNPTGIPQVVRMYPNTVGGADFAINDNGLRFNVTPGARTVLDQDVARFRIYRQGADGTLSSVGVLSSGNYTWHQ
jgi:hypothetical protein